MALLTHEFGGTDGMVSIEDIIEEIVGEIADEHDDDEIHVRKFDDGGFLADARMGLEDFSRETGVTLVGEETDENVDTLGGLVVSVIGRVPQRGETVTMPSGYEVENLE